MTNLSTVDKLSKRNIKLLVPENVQVSEPGVGRCAVFELDTNKVEVFGVVSTAELDGDGGGVISYIELSTSIREEKERTDPLHLRILLRDTSHVEERYERLVCRLHKHELERVVVIYYALESCEDGVHEGTPRD